MPRLPEPKNHTSAARRATAGRATAGRATAGRTGRRIARRSILRGLGVSLALPWLEIMRPERAAADDGSGRSGESPQPPVRLACIFQPNGVYPKAWDVAGAGKAFQLSTILSPLEAVRDQLIVLSHLDNINTRGHVQMTGAFLTGVPVKNRTNGVSLDQLVAMRVGATTPLRSLELGTEPPRQGNAGAEPIAFANTVSWSTPTTRLNPEINPQVAFDRMFRRDVGERAQRRAAARQSVVDLVSDDARALRREASRRDQLKLDEYLESVRSVERQIDRALHPPERDWTPPTRPELARPADGIPRRRDEHLQIMMDLLVLALWTDTTRVATLMTAHGFSRQNFSFLDGVTSDHHGMSHHKNQKQAVAEYTTVSRWYISQLAYLLDRLKRIDEGGSTLLDNTLVVYGSGMKDGNGHVRENLPILLAGGAGGRIAMGRHVVCRPHTPLANLHLTLAQKFGVEIDQFNGASTGTLDL